MKTFREKMSVTKLVFLILTIVLSFQTIYLTLQWIETSLFNNAMLMVISFYFGQKVWEAKADPLVDVSEERVENKPSAIWFTLEESEEDGQPL